jgi:hypothetical protein
MMEKIASSKNGAGKTGYPHDPSLLRNINSKWITGLNIRPETLKE